MRSRWRWVSTLIICCRREEKTKLQKNTGKTIKEFSTKELVRELKTRLGVDTFNVSPYMDENIKVNGPAIVLVVID